MKKTILLILFLYLAGFPSERLQNQAGADIIVDSANFIIDPEGILNPVFARLHTAESGSSGSVVIYHFGDSHVNAGFFPARFADSLQEKFGDAGRAILRMPERIKSRRVSVYAKGKRGRKNNKLVKIKGGYSAGGVLSRDERGIIPANASIIDTLGANSGTGIRYISYGVTGKDFPYFLNSTELTRQLNTVKPSMIIISLGTNDAFGRNFRREDLAAQIDNIIIKLRALAPGTPLLFTTPGEAYVRRRKPNRNIPLTGELIKEKCLSFHCACWDLYSVMGGLNSMKKWYKAGLAGGDRIHYSKAGYFLQGELLYAAFMKEYSRFLSGMSVRQE